MRGARGRHPRDGAVVLYHVFLALLALAAMGPACVLFRLAWELSCWHPRGSRLVECWGIRCISWIGRGVDPGWLHDLERRRRYK